MIDLPTDLPADIVPLSWLLGVWEGTGVIDYDGADDPLRGRVRPSRELQPRRRRSRHLRRVGMAARRRRRAHAARVRDRVLAARATRRRRGRRTRPAAAARRTHRSAHRRRRRGAAHAGGRLRPRSLDRALGRHQRAVRRAGRAARASTSPPTRSCVPPERSPTRPRPACTATSTVTSSGRGTSPRSAASCRRTRPHVSLGCRDVGPVPHVCPAPSSTRTGSRTSATRCASSGCSRRGTAVAPLGDRAVLTVAGEDRLTWLDSLTSQAVAALAPGVSTELSGPRPAGARRARGIRRRRRRADVAHRGQARTRPGC